ncbi:hypothetical protein TUBRATIS_23390 [Tubulinosema ratisbonensis]|uniref:Uncharacterized protein n=1 Tax=Tubulinosema ratisbonensis TaxID=291195 RepID=A0A437AJB1_9MICR|nr:hypothetical protein TUBRATIS_23390 [Tubulinosema ratisbonensis]
MQEEKKLREEIQKLKKENTKLLGEVSILRANMQSVEKENYSYKCEKSNSILGSLSKLDQMSKQVKYLKTENKLIENQLKTLKKEENYNNLCTDALDLNSSLTLLPFEYERLKKMHDFSFYAYKQILDTEFVKEELNKLKTDYKIFSQFFIITCIKKDLFEYFLSDLIFGYFFQDFPDPKLIFKVLVYFPIEWIQSFFTDSSVCELLNKFLSENVQNNSTILFYIRIIEHRHYLLKFVMNNNIFTNIIKRNDYFSKHFLKAMRDKGINQFIDHSNLHFIDENLLKGFFKEDYVDL